MVDVDEFVTEPSEPVPEPPFELPPAPAPLLVEFDEGEFPVSVAVAGLEPVAEAAQALVKVE